MISLGVQGRIGYRSGRGPGSKGKIDYRETLIPQDFAVFARLRDRRKEIAQAEGVPVHTLFTNEQRGRWQNVQEW